MSRLFVLRALRVLVGGRVCAPRVVAVCLACAMAALAGVQSDAQSQAPPFFVPGRSVNTLGPILDPPPPGTPDPLAGNPYAKQRNEPSCDVSPYNQMVVLCAYNDYRGIPIFNDSWIGLSMSNNGGRTWSDRLLDGFPTAPAGIGAADPIVRAVPGLAVIAYITLDANKNRGTLSVAQMLEKNRENGEPYQFLNRYVIDIGNSGRFLDKPDMEVVLDPSGGTIQVGGHAIPRARVYFSYAVFTGTGPNGNGASIYSMYSDDYGETWSNPKKLSASLGANQGVDIAVDDATGTVITTWRQIADNNQADAIIFSRSTNRGQTWSQAQPLWTAPSAGRFFDQDTSIFQFRTLSMPAIVHDGTAFHVYFSARGFSSSSPDDARIVASNSTDGLTWSAPVQVSPNPARGHQVVPQAAVGGGSIQVDWIDTRNNDPQSFDRSIADFRYTLNGASFQRIPIDAPVGASPEFVYRTSADIYGTQAAVGLSQAYSAAQAISRYRFGLDTDGTPRQLEFDFVNARMFRTGTTPFHGDYHAIASQRYIQTDSGAWIRNAGPAGTNPNAGPMTNNALFYAAFTDNRDVRGFVWLGLASTPYTAAATGAQESETSLENAQACTPVGNTAESTTEYPSPNDAPRSRFQNVYAAPVYPGLVVMSPSGTKPIVGTTERAYVVFAQNLTDTMRSYRFTISSQPAGGRAAFSPAASTVFDSTCVVNTNCQQVDVTIQRGSSATRTVYVKSTDARPRIRVKVTENATPTPQTGSVLLNGMPPDIAIETAADLGLPDLSLSEGYQPDILSRSLVINNALLINPDLTAPQPTTEYPRDGYPRDGYPRDGYPRDGYPRDGYPRDGYHSVAYPRDGYPRDGYPRDGYSRLGNSALTYSAISANDITPTLRVADLTWPVITAAPSSDGTTFGNTVTGMSAQIFINGTIPPTCDDTVKTNCLKGAQLIVWVPHFYTAIVSCSGQRATVFDNQIILNTVIKPQDLASVLSGNQGPNTVNPDLTQPTFWVGPKQVVFSTLRLFGELTDTQFQTLANHAGTIVRAQPDTSTVNGSNDSQDGTIDTTPPTLDLSGATALLAHVEGNTAGGANVSVTVTATDDNGGATVSCVRTQGSSSVALPADGTQTFIPLGSWTGRCTAVDAAGNQTTPPEFPISVADTTPPLLDVSGLAATITLTASVNGAILSYTPAVVSVTDVVDATVTATCTPLVGSVLPAGSAEISCSSTDKSGNTATATYAFTVGKAATTTTVTVANATYDASPHGATASVTSAGGLNEALTVTYTGTGTTVYGPTSSAPGNAGTYRAAATYPANAGYETSSDSALFTIAKATSATTVTCPPSVPYAGVPVTPCSATVVGAGGLSLSAAPTYTNNTSVGIATATYTYGGGINHTGSSDSKTFSITAPYGFVAVSIPASGNQGSVFPISWRYTLNGTPFNSASLLPDFRAVQLTSCTNGVETGAPYDNQFAAGNSDFQFTATSPFTWQYNWQTKAFLKATCYNIYIVTKNSAGLPIQTNGPFKVQLK